MYDNVLEDESPLVVTVDFRQFENGAKMSTIFRTYFNSDPVTITFEEFVFTLISEKIKATESKRVIEEAKALAEQQRRQIEAELNLTLQTIEQETVKAKA